MIALSLAEIAAMAGGTLHGVDDPALLVPGPVVADSRQVVPGALFVAVQGERVDGHQFAARAIDDGAVAVLAARPLDVPAVVVDDPVQALGRLAREYLRSLPSPVVVGITGSSGKTSTKDVMAQLLAEHGPTIAPVGSLNTEIGLPLTVLRADAHTRYLALEMSARGIGHIAYLCGIAPPHVGVVLNVGTAHVGEFGSREAVAKAKGELVEALAADGVAVLNADDPLVSAMRDRTDARVVRFGIDNPDAEVRAVDVRLDELARATFRLVTPAGEVPVALQLHGAHQVANALAAVAAALELGLDVDALAAGLGRVRPVSAWRMQVQERADGLIVVNDAYNANPESMGAALSALAAMSGDRPTWAVLGEMAELGDYARQAHEEVGTAAARAGVRRLVVVGEAAAGIAAGARAAGLASSLISQVGDVDDALALLRAELPPEAIVLVKASRSAQLQRVAEALLAEAAG